MYLTNLESQNTNNKKECDSQIVDFNPILSIIILNANGPNTPVKRQRLSDQI